MNNIDIIDDIDSIISVLIVLLAAFFAIFIITLIISIIIYFIKIILSTILAFITTLIILPEIYPDIDEASGDEFLKLFIKCFIILTIFIYYIISIIIEIFNSYCARPNENIQNNKNDDNNNDHYRKKNDNCFYGPAYLKPKPKKEKTLNSIIKYFSNPVKTFKPDPNLYYCFFEERNGSPNPTSIRVKNGIFGIYNSSDIQRYFYYPGTQNIETFIGFENQDEMLYTISESHLLSSAIGKKVYLYHFSNYCPVYKPINRNYNHTKFKQSIYSNESSYYYFEKQSNCNLNYYNNEENESNFSEDDIEYSNDECKNYITEESNYYYQNDLINSYRNKVSTQKVCHYNKSSSNFIKKESASFNVKSNKVNSYYKKNKTKKSSNFNINESLYKPKALHYSQIRHNDDLNELKSQTKQAKSSQNFQNKNSYSLSNTDQNSLKYNDESIRKNSDETNSQRNKNNNFSDIFVSYKNQNGINKSIENQYNYNNDQLVSASSCKNESNNSFNYKPNLKIEKNETNSLNNIQFSNNDYQSISSCKNESNNNFNFKPNLKIEKNEINSLNNIQFKNKTTTKTSSNTNSRSKFIYKPESKTEQKQNEIISKEENNQCHESSNQQIKKKSSINKFQFTYKPSQDLNKNIEKSNKNTINKISSNNKFVYTPTSDKMQEENIITIKNDEKNIKLFIPDESLYYIYFKEKSYNFQSSKSKNSSFYGISNIDEIQRCFKLELNDSNNYTFLGFSRSLDCKNAKNILLKLNDNIDTSSISDFDNDDDYESLNDEYEEIESDVFKDEIDEMSIYLDDSIHDINKTGEISHKEAIRFDSINKVKDNFISNKEISTNKSNIHLVKEDVTKKSKKHQKKNRFVYSPK